MDSAAHLLPLLVNSETGEPYLRLLPPHSNIIITPPRMTDAEAIVPILNDERVYKWLEGPPYPYLLEHAKYWLEETSKSAESLLQELNKNPGIPMGGCPVRTLREVKEDGKEIFLGDCRIGRWLWDEIKDPVQKERMLEKNDARAPGDPDIVWGFGDYLAPSHQGKGIMTTAIRTLLEQWIVPRMGATRVKASVWKGNKGSVRVFEKNGFVLEQTLEDWKEIPESKGGGRIGIHVMSWESQVPQAT